MPGEKEENIILKRLQTLKEAKVKAARFCVYQERTQKEVFDKLTALGLSEDESNEVLSELIQEDFVNEERFARLFASGKFRLKKWGRRKILFEMKRKGLSEYCQRKGLEEIEHDEYVSVLDSLIEKKSKSISDTNRLTRKSKITRFLISKGYEPDLITNRLTEQGY